MITAQLVSPWSDQAARQPKIAEDYTLESCRMMPAKTGSSFAKPGHAGTDLSLSDGGSPVLIRCSHEVWAAIVNDLEYQRVYWYQENNNPKRVLGRA